MLKTLPELLFDGDAARPLLNRPAIQQRGPSSWVRGARLKKFRHWTTKTQQPSSFQKLHLRPRRITSVSSFSNLKTGSTSRRESSYGIACRATFASMKDPTDRVKTLQHLARIWGKNAAELRSEVECTWINATVAPFLMDAFLETANLIEAAQQTLQTRLSRYWLSSRATLPAVQHRALSRFLLQNKALSRLILGALILGRRRIESC